MINTCPRAFCTRTWMLIIALSLAVCWLAPGYPDFSATAAEFPDGFVKAQGDHLVVSGSVQEIHLRGVNFTNNYYGGSWEEIKLHPGHGEADYERVRAMGMNCVRLNLNGALMEDPANPGHLRAEAWTMLDNNIKWARRNGIFLVLDMHVPPGGDWLDSSNPHSDFSLWEDEKISNRLVQLWRELAAHYRNESTIAAYDLLNEPLASGSDGQAWRRLAQDCASAVRSADPHHMLIVERLYGCNGEWELPGDESGQFLIDDANVMYDFHFYEPFLYTHQGADWAGLEDYDGGRYPDNTRAMIPEEAEWDRMIDNNPVLPEGTSGWKYYTGALYRPGGEDVLVGSPILVAGECTGQAWFDSIEIREYDENQKYLRTLGQDGVDGKEAWCSYSADDSGRFGVDSGSGHGDGTALFISSTGSDANFNNSSLAFPVTNNHYYQVNGWMKGRNINEEAWCCLSLEFYRLPAGVPISLCNSRYLESCLREWTAFGREHQVPVSMMEFGLMSNCFAGSRGGVQWVGDILDIASRQELNWAYWCYHDDDMGIYRNGIEKPAGEQSSNQALVALFKKKLAAP